MLKCLTMSDRIKYIVEHRKTHCDRGQIQLRNICFQKVLDENPNDMKALQSAKALAYYLSEKKILIKEFDVLAGFAFRTNYDISFPFIKVADDYDPVFRPTVYRDTFVETENTKEFFALDPDDERAKDLDRFALCYKNWMCMHWETGHIIPSFKMMLTKGLRRLAGECEASAEANTGARKGFAQSMLICARAASDYILRYADLAFRLAEQATRPEYKKQMILIGKTCEKIAFEPAETFFEAVQLIWLLHEMIVAESFPASESIGRLDQLLYPYYQSDLDKGIITYDGAAEVIDALWIKFGALLHAFQNVTIGGIDRDGRYMDNPVTYMCTEATRKLRFDQPQLTLRYDRSIPEKLWQESIACLKTGIGFPAFFNDPGCIQAKIRAGLAEEDAYDYAMIGCVEAASPGKEYAKSETLRINWPKILEMMLRNGKSSSTEDIVPLFTTKRLEDIQSFDELYEWFMEELLEYHKMCIRALNLMDQMMPWYYPTPLLSMTMEGCVENALDVTAGGTRYNSTGLNACGMSNVCDSLAAIRKVVYEDRRMSLSEFADIVNADFEGHEALLKYIRKKCPKFGNDDDSVDAIMKDMVARVAEVVDHAENPRGGKYLFGLYSVEDHAILGTYTGTTPDGRKKGFPLANAIAPVQGSDTEGPTAVINSVVKTDLSVATNLMVLDLKFNPQFFKNEMHIDALKALIQSYFDRGGLEIQFNVVARETLEDAYRHPERYEDLVVRVSGFSAYFVTLREASKIDIISRTEYAGF